MEGVRVRVVFDDRRMLSKSLKLLGLKRCWLLLRPFHDTINDVVSYLLHSFDLHRSCPNGLVLSMDGFTLPPFESTSILKDKDLIRVKRKGDKGSHIAKIENGAKTFGEDEIVEKLPLPSGLKLLANVEFGKETGGYKSGPEEDEDEADEDLHVEHALSRDVSSKKRKSSNKAESSKRKRQRQVTPDSDEPKSTSKKKKKGEIVDKDGDCTPEVTAKTTTNITKPSSHSNEIQKNKEEATSSDVADGQKKISRSTRRKRLKRHFKKEARAKAEKEARTNAEKEVPGEQQVSTKDANINSGFLTDAKITTTELEQEDEDSDTQGGIVPIVVRPGHIRFAPFGKGKDVQRNEQPMETFQWNGITSKRKGQKWGSEKQSSSTWNGYKDFNNEYSSAQAARKELHVESLVDFKKLAPVTDLPKQGDIIAYRLLELSSAWCPELSSFRIGKISSFDPKSNRIILVPVPEYPFNFKKKIDEDTSAEPPETSLYNEDGSLEIDFPSLVDVRIVKSGDLTPSEADNGVGEISAGPSNLSVTRVDDAKVGSNNGPSDLRQNGNAIETRTRIPENGKKDVWEEISEALSAKKAQLQQDSWNKRKSSLSSRPPWSHRNLRGGGLGPTMAMLRAQNGA